jgi:hypothetical protein
MVSKKLTRMSGARSLERCNAEPPGGGTVPPPDIIYLEMITMAEFIYLYRNSPEERKKFLATPEVAQKGMQRWMAWMRDLESKGHLKSAGQPLDPDGKVVRGPTRSITDGPFIEAKDVIGGFSIIEARDIAEAAELAKGCPAVDGSGSVEIRPVMKMDL